MAGNFELQVNNAMGVLRRDIGSIQGKAFEAFAKTFIDKTPKVTGKIRKTIQVYINNQKVSIPHLKLADAGDELSLRSKHPAVAMLEKGLYKNPGKPHYSKHKTIRVIRRAGAGWILIRTNKRGFSLKQPKGMLRFARTAFARAFKNAKR